MSSTRQRRTCSKPPLEREAARRLVERLSKNAGERQRVLDGKQPLERILRLRARTRQVAGRPEFDRFVHIVRCAQTGQSTRWMCRARSLLTVARQKRRVGVSADARTQTRATGNQDAARRGAPMAPSVRSCWFLSFRRARNPGSGRCLIPALHRRAAAA